MASIPWPAAKALDSSLQPVKPGLLVAGTNCVNTDAVAMALMGFDPMADRGKAPFETSDSTLALAEGLGVGSRDLKRIEVVGTPIAKGRFDFRRGLICFRPLPGYVPELSGYTCLRIIICQYFFVGYIQPLCLVIVGQRVVPGAKVRFTKSPRPDLLTKQPARHALAHRAKAGNSRSRAAAAGLDFGR